MPSQALITCVVRSTRREPVVGDLVHHWIFPRHEWVALLLKINHEEDSYDDKAFVRMVPGVKHEQYFTTIRKPSNGYGWIHKKWLWVYNEDRTDIEIIESFFSKKRK
jgi:hypothetical protein